MLTAQSSSPVRGGSQRALSASSSGINLSAEEDDLDVLAIETIRLLKLFYYAVIAREHGPSAPLRSAAQLGCRGSLRHPAALGE